MSWLYRQYHKNINGIIATLVFHILVFSILNITQFRTKTIYQEPEMIIEFPRYITDALPVEAEPKPSDPIPGSAYRTNRASNRSLPEKNRDHDEQFQRELEDAQRLAREVSKQLSREIPTLNDLQMPEESSEGLNIDSLKNKLYSGESNVEYELENRFHLRLPIPVYLAQDGGKVQVQIEVNREGKVVRAEPLIKPGLSDPILSYAKTAALRTRFNPSPEAPIIQKGSIYYTFIPQ